MGSYEFICKKCEHEFTHEGDKFSAIDVYDEPCPNCGEHDCLERSYRKINNDWKNGTGAPAMIDRNRLAFAKKDAGFQELLSKIHEGTPGSQLDKKM